MNSIRKMLLVVAPLCLGLSMVGCAAGDLSDADADVATVGDEPLGDGPVGEAKEALVLLDELTDRCSGSVKFVDAGNGQQLVLNRTNPNVFTPFSSVMPITNRHLTWLCFPNSSTATGPFSQEASTCPSGTAHIQARLGPNRLLDTLCLN